jgi:hypothetical protein
MNPVSTLRTITCDCGRAALFESTTFPPKLAVVYCAYAGEIHTTKTPVTIDNDVGDRIVFLLSGWSGFRNIPPRAERQAQHTPRSGGERLIGPRPVYQGAHVAPRGHTPLISAVAWDFYSEFWNPHARSRSEWR